MTQPAAEVVSLVDEFAVDAVIDRRESWGFYGDVPLGFHMVWRGLDASPVAWSSCLAPNRTSPVGWGWSGLDIGGLYHDVAVPTVEMGQQ